MTLSLARVGLQALTITRAPRPEMVDLARLRLVVAERVSSLKNTMDWRDLEALALTVGPGWSLSLPEPEEAPRRGFDRWER